MACITEKKITPPSETAAIHEDAEKVEEGPETVPPRETLEAGSQHAKAVTGETIKEATKEEVEHENVKLDHPKAVTMPSEKAEKAEKVDAVVESKPASATFFIQLGSYTSKKEAAVKVKGFAKKGVNSDIQVAEVAGVTRYRVVVPGFKSKGAAEMYGRDLKQKHKIENFIVIK